MELKWDPQFLHGVHKRGQQTGAIVLYRQKQILNTAPNLYASHV